MVDSIRQHEGREQPAEADERQRSWKESDEKRFGPGRPEPHDPEPAPIPVPKKSYDRAFHTGWSVVKADPDMEIRAVGASIQDPTYSHHIPKEHMTTMHPIIARLIEERNKERGHGRGADMARELWDKYAHRTTDEEGNKFSGDFKQLTAGRDEGYGPRRAGHRSSGDHVPARFSNVEPGSMMDWMNRYRSSHLGRTMPENLQPAFIQQEGKGND